MIEDKDNEWLDSAVRGYIANFGFVYKPVIWEVGSRDGIDAVELARRIFDTAAGTLWKNTRIVCLEPNPEQAEIIRRNYPKAQVLELAVSDTVGEQRFKVYHGDQGTVGSSSLNLKWKEGVKGHIIKVKVERLDNLVGDEQIDIMKIDIEGFSEQALIGLGDRIRQVKVFHVETETWSKSNNRIRFYMLDRGFFLADEQQQYGGMPDQVWINSDLARDSMKERLADILEPDQ